MTEGLKRALFDWGIDLTPEQVERFRTYYALLKEENAHMNLVGDDAEVVVYQRHFLDSCAALRGMPPQTAICADIGTGAGFPGIPLKIIRPEVRFLLLDAQQKRIAFLERVRETLGLEGLELVHGRAEEVAKDPRYRERYHVVVSRAVMRFSGLLELMMPFVALDGRAIVMKSGKADEEYTEASAAITTLGGGETDIMHYNLPSAGRMALYSVEKKEATPEKYPRKFNQIRNKPL
ncbi:16S rRNA (guanine(527)-N(7))-methyltransferase RsmG [Oscillospiraceae bacterium OttesenSCG-928-F05]|nr:16S rRNA (guanine(527)-N(7))-methyltransferase RsmG [Oscillospiraceae bacterium OttesenSCG-928-F05]